MTRRRLSIPAFGLGLSLLLVVALAAGADRAEATDLGAFDKLDAINIAVEVGGPLDLEGGTSPELFTAEVGRFGRFRRALAHDVGLKVESCGILWDQSTRNDVVSIFVFGRREQPPQGPPVYVFMVHGEVLNSELAKFNRTETEPYSLRSVIGIADDDGLEAAIIAAALTIVTDELGICD